MPTASEENYRGKFNAIARLFLEQILEGLSRVRGPRGRLHCGGYRHFLSIGGGCGVLFDGHAKFVEGAIIFRVLRRDALGNVLRAFKLRSRIEKTALLAAVQFKLAFWADAIGIEPGGEHRSAVGAASTRYGADHARGARTKLICAARTALRWLAFAARFFFLFVLFGIAITAMAVLSVHKRLRPQKCGGLVQEI